MNIIRTIQWKETDSWIKCLFGEEPDEELVNSGCVPAIPVRLPFPFKLRADLKGGFAYLIYRRYLIGYQKIKKIENHGTDYVGSGAHLVGSGQEVVLDRVLVRTPKHLSSLALRGFQGVRYTPSDLHQLSKERARKALQEAGIKVLGG